jgi:GxxExxY protein
MEHEKLTEAIIGCAMKVHRTLGSGFLESVYQKALEHELKKAGLSVIRESPLTVYYDGVSVGDFFADMIVEDTIVIETKATQSLVSPHEVQLVNYLNAIQKDIGLLLNFGAASLQIKRKFKNPINNPVNPENPVNPVKKTINNPVNLLNPVNPVKKESNQDD